MRNILLLPISTRARQLNILTLVLLCCLLGACSATRTTRQNLLLIHRPISIDASLREQGQLQTQTFERWIGLMRQYGGQTAPYSQELLSDQQALHAAKDDANYQNALHALQQHTESIEMPALKNDANYQQQQLLAQASAWGQDHTYHDSYNGTTYHMGYEYGPDGVAGWVQDELSSAKTLADYQQAIADANMFLTNFQAYQSNASDTTTWNSVHQADLQLLHHYHALHQRVVVVSLSEEVMRVYDHGTLVKAFHVTTGRPEKPSLPGFWSVEEKRSPTVFKSDEPRGSAYWYPDTPINYAMLYHSGGYFLHDSWWRDDYGPNTQFPHYDSSGDSFSFDGSHGCVNISTDNAAWLYHFIDVNTPVLIY